MNKKIILPIATLSLLGTVAAYGFTATKAYNGNNNGELSPLVQKIIEKFNLNKDEVTKLVDQTRTERQAEMEKKFEDRLTELVKNGKLTEAQKNALIAKHKEMKANKQDIREMTREERQNKMQEERNKYEEWAKSQGIDLSLVQPMGPQGNGMHKGFDR